MYGGGLGMGGMGSMYGGGLGMGGMGSMYGGGLGMGGMGSMYGSGMGSMGGMYGSSMGGMGSTGMYGNSGLGSTGLGGGINTTTNNTMQGFGTGVDPVTGQPQPASPISTNPQTSTGIPGVCGPPPPLNESPEDRVKRIRAERRNELELVRQQKQKREQMRFQAKMEMAGHFTNVLVQSLRSVVEFCTVCFGTYYSMKTFRQMASMPQMSYQRGANGMMIPVPAPAAPSAAAVASDAVAKSSSKGWKAWAIFSLLFIVVEVVYNIASRRISNRKNESRAPVKELQDTDVLDSDLELSDEEEEESAADAGPSRAVYVALHDFDGENDDFLSFKAGDKFVVSNYSHDMWCIAQRMNQDANSDRCGSGYVPTNYLKLLERTTKL